MSLCFTVEPSHPPKVRTPYLQKPSGDDHSSSDNINNINVQNQTAHRMRKNPANMVKENMEKNPAKTTRKTTRRFKEAGAKQSMGLNLYPGDMQHVSMLSTSWRWNVLVGLSPHS